MREKTNIWRVNQDIRAAEVRVIGTDGKMVGVMGLTKALELAKKESLDLVEVASGANPPVTKIVDFGKFRYAEEKKAKKEKQKAKASELKEVRFSPFIAQNDYLTRIERIKEFLAESSKVKTVVVFKGRQMGSKKFGYELLERIIRDLGDGIVLDMEPKFFGRHLAMVVSPTKKAIEKYAKTKNQKVNNKKV